MKKITLMLLVAMVPFLTMAQKRSKKGKSEEVSSIHKKSKSSVEYLIIKGVEFPLDKNQDNEDRGEDVREMEMKKMLKPNVKLIVSLDFGSNLSRENTELARTANDYRSMGAVVNALAEKGWEFVSANVVPSNGVTTHYYYMRRKK